MNKQAKFQKLVKEGLEKLGAKENKEHGYKFFLNTIAGKLLLTFHESDVTDKSEVYSLYTRFEDPKEAVKKFPSCNPYSGKWNFNIWLDPNKPEIAAETILNVIKTTLKLNKEIK